ncbi:MAG: hypothetical protein KDD43_03475, partial [Bdellovibrionales bacterium]|nr:hypothetical protein [Bdellovibrionales bacterium]
LMMNLAAPKSVERYHLWVKAKASGVRVSDLVDVSSVHKHPLQVDRDFEYFERQGGLRTEVLQYEEKVLAQMVKQWGSEERVWQLFGALGEETVFIDAFKKTRPLWRAQYESP